MGVGFGVVDKLLIFDYVQKVFNRNMKNRSKLCSDSVAFGASKTW